MDKKDKLALLAEARRARKRARAAYSGFRVGAALLTRNGTIVGGANIESASYGLTCCAERVGLFKALSEGLDPIVAIAVVARIDGGPMPCGACRQLLMEYAPNARVLVSDVRFRNRFREFDVTDLLPDAFVAF